MRGRLCCRLAFPTNVVVRAGGLNGISNSGALHTTTCASCKQRRSEIDSRCGIPSHCFSRQHPIWASSCLPRFFVRSIASTTLSRMESKLPGQTDSVSKDINYDHKRVRSEFEVFKENTLQTLKDRLAIPRRKIKLSQHQYHQTTPLNQSQSPSPSSSLPVATASTTTTTSEITHKKQRRAAVLVPFCNYNGVGSVLFTRRSDKLKLHRGEVSFPGGLEEDQDGHDLTKTAVRETSEELGVEPKDIQLLGMFHDVLSLTKIPVTPVLGFLGNLEGELNARFAFNRDEISDVFTLSFDELLDETKQQYREWSTTARLKVFTAGPYPVWGLTAYIMDEILMTLISCK